MAFIFRQTLKNNLDTLVNEDLDDKWSALKGNLRFEPDGGLLWHFDESDPDEMIIAAGVKDVYMIASDSGTPIEGSTIYKSLGFDSPDYVK